MPSAGVGARRVRRPGAGARRVTVFLCEEEYRAFTLAPVCNPTSAKKAELSKTSEVACNSPASLAKSIRDFCVAFLKREYTGAPPRRRANVADHANTTHVYLEAKLATPATRRAPSPREGAARAAQAPRGPESEIGASRRGRVS